MKSIAQYHQEKQIQNDKIGFIFTGAFILVALFVIMPILSYYN